MSSVLVLVAGVSVQLGLAPAATADTSPNQVALTTLDDIVQGDFPAATAPFDPTMQKKLPIKVLVQAWAGYQQLLGPYLSHGDPESTQRDDLTVVNVPMQMERQPGQFRLSVRPDGTVTGLYFLKEGVPVP
jgi:hypothetical protein